MADEGGGNRCRHRHTVVEQRRVLVELVPQKPCHELHVCKKCQYIEA